MRNIAFSRSDVEREFISAMRQHGLALSPNDSFNGDGRIHRCNVIRKGTRGSGDGSYALHLNARIPYGGFQNWTNGRGWQSWWFKLGRKLTADEQHEIECAIKKARSQHEAYVAKVRAEALINAKRMWKDAEDASADHPYCQAKQLKPRGLRMLRFKDGAQPLLVPVRDEQDKIQNLQLIHKDGSKRFLKGGRQAGCHYWVATPQEADGKTTIYIAEGWATGETGYQATKGAVLVAFNADNLLATAEWARQRHPDHKIVLLADDDWKHSGNPGLTKAKEAARAVGGKVAVPVFDDERGEKETDFNDMMTVFGLDAVKQAINGAAEPDELAHDQEADAEAQDATESTERKKQTDVILTYAAKANLFHTDDGKYYADIAIDNHRETWPIRSRSFKHWLVHQYYLATNGSVPGAEPLRAAIETLEARARYEGPPRSIHLRIGGTDDKIYVDLADSAWRAVEIDAEGWRVVTNPPVRFRRAAGMLPLPAPVKGSAKAGIAALRSFVNLKANTDEANKDDVDFVLLVSFMLAALRDRGPYPGLSVQGEEGSAKTTLVRIVRALIDPHKIEERRPPREDRDLFIAANNAHLVAFGNVSQVPEWLSNSLCTLATGGGFATRQLYTDEDEVLFNATRPIALNGVRFAVRPDFADRLIHLKLPVIAKGSRRTEAELWADFETKRPEILGALLDILSYGLRELPNMPAEDDLRMADFAQWASACEGAVWDAGTFKHAYTGNRRKATIDVIEADPVADAVRSLVMAAEPQWVGTTRGLLDVLTTLVGERQSKAKDWPSEPRGLTDRLEKAKATLRRVGIDISYGPRTNKGRPITITYERQEPANDRHDRHNPHPQLDHNELNRDG